MKRKWGFEEGSELQIAFDDARTTREFNWIKLNADEFSRMDFDDPEPWDLDDPNIQQPSRKS
jgi:hypothetical protein